jgi:hypothetical protein
MNSATIAAAIRDRIEALTPADQSGPDDVFRVFIGLDTTQQGSRVGYLTPVGGIRAAGKVNRCNTWQTSFELVMYYLETPAEPGQVGQLERAVADSEDILDDLYTWASTTSGIQRIDPSQAQAADNNDGSIVIVRQFSIEFER